MPEKSSTEASSQQDNTSSQEPSEKKAIRQVQTKSGKTFEINENRVEPTTEKKDFALLERELHPVKPLATSTLPKKKEGGFFSFLGELLFILIIVWGIRTFIATPFQVEGHSMDDTLHDQEKIFINKLDTYFDTIERGDIIVFKPPYYRMMTKKGIVCWAKQKLFPEQKNDLAALCGEEPQHYVKRVIGIAGDTVEIKGGKVYLTPSGGERTELSEPYLNAENTGKTCFNPSCNSIHDREGYSFVVNEESVFVLGDNRLHSSDSRTALDNQSAFNNNGTPEPFVPLGNIVGTVKLVIWPPSEWEWFGSGE